MHSETNDHLRDFTATPRTLQLAAMAAVTGTMGAGAAWVLLRLIAVITNLAYFGRLSGAPVSLPLTWDELADAHPLDFRITNVAQRLAATGDQWKDVLGRKQSLEQALRRAKA